MEQIERSSAVNTKAIDKLRHYVTHVFNSGLTFRIEAGAYEVLNLEGSNEKETTPVPRSENMIDGVIPTGVSHAMSRSLVTVRELWSEWHVGINGQPSLSREFGTRWRASARESKFFSRRKCIIRYVTSLISQGHTKDEAIRKTDEKRGSKSLDGFSGRPS